MGEAPATAVLLVQLGTPDAPTTWAVRRYLREFLADRRVVDLPRPIWLPILHGPVLTFRAPRSAALYRRIWTPEGSPLLVHSRRLAAALQKRLAPEVRVELGMRYGRPSLRRRIEQLCEDGVERLLLAPLYPQYSATTTASTLDAVMASFRERSTLPALRVLPPFPEDAGYLQALAARMREHEAAFGRPDLWLFSFHGIPQRYADRGDIYPSHCRATARALAALLDLPAASWRLSFQSRFGPGAWLSPYTDRTLRELGARGLKRLGVVCPGFAADCLETLDEIGALGAEQFRRAGGGALELVPCLNDHPSWVGALEALLRRELGGWLAQGS